MVKNRKSHPTDPEAFCKSEINRMLKNSQTKVIMPIVTLGLLHSFVETSKRTFADAEIKSAYEEAVRTVKNFLAMIFI